mmetsp:Transcript_127176/g.368186  ORF Transcript_127176/g.368186 Transcript_127176/m.368186 type:complete len:245 (-) Transcript_127176:2-736(-)
MKLRRYAHHQGVARFNEEHLYRDLLIASKPRALVRSAVFEERARCVRERRLSGSTALGRHLLDLAPQLLVGDSPPAFRPLRSGFVAIIVAVTAVLIRRRGPVVGTGGPSLERPPHEIVESIAGESLLETHRAFRGHPRLRRPRGRRGRHAGTRRHAVNHSLDLLVGDVPPLAVPSLVVVGIPVPGTSCIPAVVLVALPGGVGTTGGNGARHSRHAAAASVPPRALSRHPGDAACHLWARAGHAA